MFVEGCNYLYNVWWIVVWFGFVIIVVVIVVNVFGGYW